MCGLCARRRRVGSLSLSFRSVRVAMDKYIKELAIFAYWSCGTRCICMYSIGGGWKVDLHQQWTTTLVAGSNCDGIEQRLFTVVGNPAAHCFSYSVLANNRLSVWAFLHSFFLTKKIICKKYQLYPTSTQQNVTNDITQPKRETDRNIEGKKAPPHKSNPQSNSPTNHHQR
jgi:hypothetical protein